VAGTANFFGVGVGFKNFDAILVKLKFLGDCHEFRVVEQLHEVVREDVPMVGPFPDWSGTNLYNFFEVLMIFNKLIRAIKARKLVEV
jgi:hypothetical protein